MVKTATKATAKPAPKPQPAAPVRQAARATTAVSRAPPEPERPAPSNAVANRSAMPAPVSDTSLAEMPAFMRNDVDLGKENIGRDDMDMPRLKLMQGLSKELPLYDDLKAGMFFHSAAEMIFDEPFRVVPLYFDRQFILWRPLEAGGGIIARAPDGVHWTPSTGEAKTKLDKKDGGHEVTWKWSKSVQESGLANWGTMNPADPNSPPAATLMYNFLLAFPDFPDLMPAVLTFQRSSIKIGRKFNTKLKTVRTPLFGSMFTLSSYIDHNATNQDFHNINITGSGLVNDKATYEAYKNYHLSISKSGLNIKDIGTLQDDPENLGGDGTQSDGGDRPGY